MPGLSWKGARNEEVLEEMTIQQLHEAISTFASYTGKGSDNTTPDLVKAMPLQGKVELLKLFNVIQARLAWPWQWLHVIIALLAKPTGGETHWSPSLPHEDLFQDEEGGH